jgi:hypothetical protein
MNRLLKLVVGTSIITTVFFGCDLLNPSSGPTCDFKDVQVSGDVTAGGGAVQVTGTLDGSADISDVAVEITTNAGAATTGFTTPYDAVTKDKLNLKDDLHLKISAASSVTAATYKMTITATVEETEFSTTVTFTVKSGSTGTALTEKTDGIISNLWGPDQGAFNLVDGVRVSSTADSTKKDLLDLSVVTEGFKGELGSANGSTFATATAADYTGATDVSVAALAASASATKIAVSTVGTVFVVKLGGGRGFAIVKITSYDATAGGSTANNKGEVEFSYKFTD